MAISTEYWAFKTPFRITERTFTGVDLLYVEIHDGEHCGRGEGGGVYYLDETGESMLADVGKVRDAIEGGVGRTTLRTLLPPGGARNAIDCALWDLEAKSTGQSVWCLIGTKARETETAMTVGLDTPDAMGTAAAEIEGRLIKVKLDDELPEERIAAVRNARPDAELIVDVNQGWSFERLEFLAPRLADLGVRMIEQPLPRGGDQSLEDYTPPLPLCADESCRCIDEFEQAARRYQMINIKLDKCGGLTEALELASLAGDRGIELMVGNMMGTSLGMAPGFVVAQRCRYVDLDGPLFLERDRAHAMTYSHGVIGAPDPQLWG